MAAKDEPEMVTNHLPPAHVGDPDDVFAEPSKLADEFDDAAILAMCDDGADDITEDDNLSSQSPRRISHFPPPFSFGMEGSTINISHSKDIHFGPKTVSSSPVVTPSPMGSHISTPSCDSGDFADDISLRTSFSSLNSQFRNSVDLNSSKTRQDIITKTSTFSEDDDDSERLSSSFLVNLNSPLGSSLNSSTPETISCQSLQQEMGSSLSLNSNAKIVRKAVSSPTGDISSNSSAILSSSRNAIQPCLPQGGQINSNPPSQMSAAINNSSNVQLGTQIIYNYRYYVPEQRVSSGSLSESINSVSSRTEEAPKDFLEEFKVKLVSFYQKRTRSAPLPWHRGNQLIPINEYYTEPQIFAVDRVGNRTSETVNIISILNSKTETRFLVEGEAGMGKTLLATKLAEEWASGQQLQQFTILLFITLGDFKGSLQEYVRDELLPSYFKPENFEKVWEYCKTHDEEILFVLDGYDEMERQDKREIQNLMKNLDFPESKVVVTSRPNFLQDWEKKIVVSGFGQLQIMQFIDKYFRAIGNESRGQALRKIIEKDEKYWKLARRPLFCMLLCMLNISGEVRESLPERQSDVMLQIILCLIKWNRKNCNSSPDYDSLPQEYEKPFYNFGKLCLIALRTEKSRFTDDEVNKVEGFEKKLKQLGFLFNDNESYALGVKKFWKPVHQTFLEYLGAFYIAKHIRDCRGCKECKGYDFVFQRSQEVLKFCVGILNNKAYKVLDGQRFPILWKLPVIKILQLLKEAENTPETCQAVAKLLDQNVVEISTSEIEFEGWSYILAQPFRRLTSLKIAWRIKSKSPDQESSFTEASEAQYLSFFEALKNNESIHCIHVRAKQDGEPFCDEKISIFFTHLQTALLKKNLKELHIVEMKMEASRYLRSAFESITRHSPKVRALQDLQVLKLHTFMRDEDLQGICEALIKCAPALESLHLEGLEHGHSGFQSLVKLLKANSNIKNLHLSMNQSKFVNAFGSGENNSQDYPPQQMRNEHKRMKGNARQKSKTAFDNLLKSQESTENNSSENDDLAGASEDDRRDSGGKTSPKMYNNQQLDEIDPRKELSYLFKKIPLNNGQWTLEAKHFWYLRKSGIELRIPLPLCVHREHKSVFHFLFNELQNTCVKNLKLSQAGLYLTQPDFMCLGHAIRCAPHLTSLDLRGLDKVDSYLPILIGLGQSPSLASVNLSSSTSSRSKVTLKDFSLEVVCAALQSNTSLRNISLSQWQFQLQHQKEAIENITKLINSWQVVQLNLNQCLIYLGDHPNTPQPQTPSSPCSQPLNAFFSRPFENSSTPWRSLKTISLEGVELKEHSGLSRRGHLLLPLLTNFINITSLDLSISQAKSVQVDNIALRRFFGQIGSEMVHLVELKLDNWEFCLQNKETGNDISSSLQSCKKLKKVQLEKVNEIVPETLQIESNWCKLTFLHQLISHAPNLEEVSLCLYRINNSNIDQELAQRIGQCLNGHWHHLPFSVKFFNLASEVDDAIYQALKHPPRKVKRTVGPSLIKTYYVKNVLNLIKRH